LLSLLSFNVFASDEIDYVIDSPGNIYEAIITKNSCVTDKGESQILESKDIKAYIAVGAKIKRLEIIETRESFPIRKIGKETYPLKKWGVLIVDGQNHMLDKLGFHCTTPDKIWNLRNKEK
jgi:hypothetical protein